MLQHSDFCNPGETRVINEIRKAWVYLRNELDCQKPQCQGAYSKLEVIKETLTTKWNVWPWLEPQNIYAQVFRSKVPNSTAWTLSQPHLQDINRIQNTNIALSICLRRM